MPARVDVSDLDLKLGFRERERELCVKIVVFLVEVAVAAPATSYVLTAPGIVKGRDAMSLQSPTTPLLLHINMLLLLHNFLLLQ